MRQFFFIISNYVFGDTMFGKMTSDILIFVIYKFKITFAVSFFSASSSLCFSNFLVARMIWLCVSTILFIKSR